MTNVILDEYDLRELPPRERLDKIKEILRDEEDESIRWDAVWLAGEIIDTEHLKLFDRMQTEIADLMVWVLKNEKNGIVKHEAAFQIGLRNMRDKIPYNRTHLRCGCILYFTSLMLFTSSLVLMKL